jgi:hypothetical protein
MRFAYADPPYPGQAEKHYADHADYAGEVDHRELIDRMERDYDAWALSTSAKALQDVLALCPPVRVLIWRKQPGTPLGDKIIYSYEPVLLRNGRKPADYTRDVVEAMPDGFLMSFRARPVGHVTGAKPEAFCRWLFQVAGLEPADELHDLFPGSGGVGRAWQAWCSQTTLTPQETPA